MSINSFNPEPTLGGSDVIYIIISILHTGERGLVEVTCPKSQEQAVLELVLWLLI